MNFLITGAAGFLGSSLADHLAREGHQVRGLDDLSTGDPQALAPDVHFTRGDVSDRPKLWTLLQEVDVVYHLAARVSVPEQVLVRVLDGQSVVLSLETEKYFGLDEVGTRMWTLLVGADIAAAATVIRALDAPIVGLNCATGPREMAEHVKWLGDNWPGPISVQPNAGLPKLVNMKVVYDQTPGEMVVGVVPMLEAGVGVLGACCGSTPEHIAAFRKAADAYLSAK